MQTLNQITIKKRMQEWRNLKVLHEKSVQQNKKLKEKNKKLRTENQQIKQENAELKIVTQDLLIRIEELEKIIFGKSKKNENDTNNNSFINPKKKKRQQPNRSKESYQRKKPKPEEITNTQKHTINECPNCQTKLRKKKIVIFYEEDIPLPNKDKQLKEVTEHQVEKGWCHKCRKWCIAIPIPPKKTIILLQYFNFLLKFVAKIVKLLNQLKFF